MLRLIAPLLSLLLLSSVVQGAQTTPGFTAESEPVFALPHDLALGPKGDYLFVADTNHNVVKVLDPNSLVVQGLIGDGELNSPHDVAFDERGHLLVADSGNNRIAIYEVHGDSGRLIGEIDGPMASPEGVTAGRSGDIYVVNTASGTVLKFQSGQLIETAGGPETYSRPHDIEVGPDGNLYLADPGNNRIVILDTALAPIAQIEQDFNRPKYLALDKKGRLYVADQHNNQLVIFNPGHQVLDALHDAGSRRLDRPEGVEAVGKAIWISDTYNNRIVRFDWP